MLYDTIAQEIIQLKAKDDNLRKELLQKGELSVGYHPEMEALHKNNAHKLEHIMGEIGYPTISKVGETASEAAWTIIQHAISLPSFMRQSAELLKHAVEEEVASPIHLAYLSDRIAVFEGRPQLYGTQFQWNKSGEFLPNVYDDLSLVNQRRLSIGLNNMEEQIEVMQQRVRDREFSPPANLEAYKMQFDEWRKKVGWLK